MKSLVEEVERALYRSNRQDLSELEHASPQEQERQRHRARAALSVAFPAIRDACAEVAREKHNRLPDFSDLTEYGKGRASMALDILRELHALTLDALPASSASGAAAEGARRQAFADLLNEWTARLVDLRSEPSSHYNEGRVDEADAIIAALTELSAPLQQQEQGGE